MKIPRDLSGSDLIKILNKFDYKVTRQKGSHIRLSRIKDSSTHHITIPNHNPLKLGTLSSILNEVALHLKIPVDNILQ